MSTIARARAVVGSLYGLLRNRLGLNVATALESQELSCTVAPDRRLVVLGHEPIAGFARDHGTVADAAAMLALHTLDSTTLIALPTFVAPGDSVLRSDDPGWRWHCIAGHGQVLSDWERRPLGGALSGLAVSGHTHPISAITDLQSALAGKQAALSNAAVVAALGDTGGVLTYGGTPVGGGGGGSSIEPIAYGDIDWGGTDYAWVSDGDANGIFHAIGVAAGSGVWVDPRTAGAITVSAYSNGGALYGLLDRTANDAYAGNASEPDVSWLQVELAAAWATRVSAYSIRGSANGYNLPRSWVLLGSNDGEAWTALDTRSAELGAEEWGTYTLGGSDSGYYRFFRLLCHGMDGSGYYRMRVGEFEIYGRVLALDTPANPSWANTWMTDGAGHYWPAYAS